MGKYANLEIELRREDEVHYAVQFRYQAPNSAAQTRPGGGVATLDLEALREWQLEPEKYGVALTGSLFEQPDVRNAFDAARASAEALGVPLRMRLLIDDNAPELHQVRWETLQDPRDGSYLCANENLLLSRYAMTTDFRPVRLGLKSSLSALVVVANPFGLDEYPSLGPIDVEQETAVARQALGQTVDAWLPQPDGQRRASFANLLEELGQTRRDILYVVCHGTISDRQSWLWLEDENGSVARVSGGEFVNGIQHLGDDRPSLIVLASCLSAGRSAGEALTAVGPRLTVAGVPAVVAMQGTVSMDTATAFMSAFFTELREHGVIDRATAVARGRVRDHPDFWMPVLFMRLEQGRIWSGFTDSGAFRKWPALRQLIEHKSITPVLGSGLFEPLLGSLRDIASKWAREYDYPLYEHEHDSLAQISQYLAVEQFPDFPVRELETYMRKEIQRNHGDELPDALLGSDASLDELINHIGSRRRERVQWDAYRVMAALDLPIYITTNFNKLLESALEEQDKEPQTLISPWNDYVEQSEPHYSEISRTVTEPTPERPLVYHLFGRLDQPASVVLTEDDYFEYLIGITRNDDLLPMSVQEALTKKALLFLGFRLEDWDFRVLLRSLLSFEGKELRLRDEIVNIAVQLEPEGLPKPDVARTYLESYLGKENIYLFWGSTEDFVKELMYYLPSNNGSRGR